MSAFKDMVEVDISDVFLNPDVFGETHNLNGTDCICVISSDMTDERKASLAGGKRTPEGLPGAYLTICVKSSE